MVKEKACNEDEKEKEIVCCDASMFYQLVNVKVHSSNLTKKNTMESFKVIRIGIAIVLDIDMHTKVSDAF